MDAELKAKWIAALRSGEYAQTVGTLRRPDGERFYYCCLGVLYCAEGLDVPRKITPDRAALERWKMPDSTRIYLECLNDGGIDEDGCHHERHTFSQIADHIESSSDL